MRRGLLVMLALLPLGATAWAQTQVLPPTARIFAPPDAPLFVSPVQTMFARVSPDLVVNRIMSFDRNSDGRVEKAELAERMHSVLSRGDINNDGALDTFEIQKLAATPRAQDHGAFGSGNYGFADQFDTSSRFHIEDSLEDLRLQSPTKELALAAVTGYVDKLETAALTDLLRDLEGLLTPEQLIEVKLAVKSQQQRPQTLTSHTDGTGSFVVRRTDLGLLVQRSGLAPPQRSQARGAVERYKTRLRLDNAHRSELLDQVKNILSKEESGNFEAALNRRPMVANGGVAIRIVGGVNELRKEAVTGGGFQNLLFFPTD